MLENAFALFRESNGLQSNVAALARLLDASTSRREPGAISAAARRRTKTIHEHGRQRWRAIHRRLRLGLSAARRILLFPEISVIDAAGLIARRFDTVFITYLNIFLNRIFLSGFLRVNRLNRIRHRRSTFLGEVPFCLVLLR